MEDQRRRRGNSSRPTATPRADGEEGRGRRRLGGSSFSRRRGRTRLRRQAGRSVFPASAPLCSLISPRSSLCWADTATDTYPKLSFKAHYGPVCRYVMDTYPRHIPGVSVSDTYWIRDTWSPGRIGVVEAKPNKFDKQVHNTHRFTKGKYK